MGDSPMFKLKNIGTASLDGNKTSSETLAEGENIEIFAATNNEAGIETTSSDDNLSQSNKKKELNIYKKISGYLFKRFDNLIWRVILFIVILYIGSLLAF